MPYDPLGGHPFDMFRATDMYESAGPSTSTFPQAPTLSASDWYHPSGASAWQRGPQASSAQPTASTSQACDCGECRAAAAGLRSHPGPHGTLPHGVSNMYASGAYAAPPAPLPSPPNQPGQIQQNDMLRLPNLQPISMPTPQLQYQQQQQQLYNPLNFLASGYLPAPFINTGQPSTPSFVYSAPAATRGYTDGASAVEEALSSRSRPQLAPISTRPVAQGLPTPQPTGERLAPSPRRRSIPSETSPLPSETSPTTGESGNEERVDSPTPFINKLHFLLSSPEYDCIRWTADGRSFVFAASSPELITAFAQVFRHRNTNSFVRQLNIYNFKRLSGVELHDALAGSTPSSQATFEYTGFTHSLFFRDAPGRRCDLGKIKPTKGKHYSAARRSSAGSVGGASAGGANKAHILRGKGKVGGSVAVVDGAERKYSVSG
ncbi:hypothetical protein JCM8115_001929 [Rhodotorula mucilaginosa]